jgi:hypothetical protein
VTIEEHLRGVGSLWLNGKLIRSQMAYSVDVGPSPRGVGRRIRGRIDVDPLGDGARLMMMDGIAGPNTHLVLELEDGRRWDCVLTNNSGDLLNRGGFDDPSKGR